MLNSKRLFFCNVTMLLTLLAPRFLASAELPRCIEPDKQTGMSSAVVVGDVPLVHTGQVLPPDTSANANQQVKQLLDRIDEVLNRAESKLTRLIKLNVYVTKTEFIAAVQRELARRFDGSFQPAVSFVVTRLPIDGAVVAADAVATTMHDPGRNAQLVTDEKDANSREAAVSVIPNGTRIYVSGQAGRSKSLAEATRLTLEGLRKTLRFLRRNDVDIVQLKAFLQPMSQVADVENEIAAFFGDKPIPPVVFVEWKSSETVPIEIELIAFGGRNRTGEVVEFLTPPEMSSSPVFSRVARINHSHSIYVSGLYAPLRTQTDADPEGETRSIFAAMNRIVKQGGSDLRHLVKATYYVASPEASTQLGKLRPEFYDPQRPPAASKAAVDNVGRAGAGLSLDMIAVPDFSDDHPEYGHPEQGHGLTANDAAAGWISLFDGKTTFGWKGAKLKGSPRLRRGKSAAERRTTFGHLSEGTTTTQFGNCELRVQIEKPGTIRIGDREWKVKPGRFHVDETLPHNGAASPIELGDGVAVSAISLRPLALKSLFNGKNLDGWKRIDRENLPVERRPKWDVEDGILRAREGSGALEYTGGLFDDMVMQIDVRTRRRHANGGIFIRAIPGDFMNGYEVQVFNRAENGNPAHPAVWSTGGIDDRENARRLISRDGHFYRTTIITNGPHIATWINGYQQTDFTDTRPKHPNARRGLRTEAGAIQLQSHDPETDVEFKNIEVGALKVR